MKKIILFVFLVSLIGACVSSRKHLDRGEYDAAISKAIKKIVRKRTREKEILVLEQAYKKANDKDKESVLFLKKEGTPENWKNILDLYVKINSRQERIKPLLPLKIPSTQRIVEFEIVNYDEEIIQAKQKAAEYFYTHALVLLEKNDKVNIRKAYYELSQVKSYYPSFRDVDDYLKKAKALGTSHILFKMQNKTNIPLPPSFEQELTKISLTDLNGEWLDYQVYENKNVNYDYTILVNMKIIDVAPEAVKEIYYKESREVQDGWQYTLDAKGNVKKDSLGNDVKTKKFKAISCNVVENYQSKKAIISGSLDYIDNHSGQLLKTDPITSESFFEHRSALAIGDINALKPETKAKIGRSPVPFPTGFDMLLQAGETMKDMIKNILWRHKNILY